MDQLTFAFAPPVPERGTPIRELPAEEQPTHRIHHFGANAISTAELLCSLAGLAYHADAFAILARFGGLEGLARANMTELEDCPGIGPAAAARLRAAIELGRRLQSIPLTEKPQIRAPADAAELLLPEMRDLEKEHLIVLLLDTKNRVTAKITVYIGSLNTSLIRIGELLRPAIRANAASIIVAHNHPSGAPRSA